MNAKSLPHSAVVELTAVIVIKFLKIAEANLSRGRLGDSLSNGIGHGESIGRNREHRCHWVAGGNDVVLDNILHKKLQRERNNSLASHLFFALH